MDAARYSEALEQQLALFRRWSSRGGGAYIHVMSDATGADGDNYWDAVCGPLAFGAPFYWAPAMCELLSTSAATLPDWTLHADDLPARNGFCWFATPLPLPDAPHNQYGPVRALGWVQGFDTSTLPAAPEPIAGGLVNLPPDLGPQAIQLMFWQLDAKDELYPTTSVRWTVGMTLSDLLTGLVAARPSYAGDARIRHKVALVGAAWALLGQRLLRASPAPIARASRRRVERQGWHMEPVVRVVELRRTEHQPAATESIASVDWHCRWMVAGHWREQPCGPGRVLRRPTWVLPYVKGPEDKPLKPPSTKVFAVVR